MSLSDAETDRIRQSERTVDNLKRLYAVLFALSFSILATGTVAKIKSAIVASQWNSGQVLLNIEMTVGFALTAGLFYYQGDRFLDVVLARRPIPNVTAADFAFSYLVNVLTMAPFYLMAYALGEDALKPAGFTWYFLGYLALITNGLVWLFLRAFARFLLRLPRGRDDLEALNAFWMIMNSAMLLLVVALYLGFAQKGGRCVAGRSDGIGIWFVAALGLIILIRDILDFLTGWPVLYPVLDPQAEIDRRPLLRALHSRHWRVTAFWASIVFGSVSLYLIWISRLWEIGAYKTLCG